MNVIETAQLTRRFGATDAVHQLDLVVPAGSVCALLGPNGAGKTTTIKLLMNLLRPTAGAARVLGVDSRRLGPHEFARIGYVSENQELPRWMTVRQFLDYCRPFYPTWDCDLESRLLGQLALPADRKLRHLSRGMAMKAALLAALAYRPQLVVLDEPFGGLDPLVREEFIHGLLEASEAGEWTMLVSSHDIEEVERLADRVALLDAGRLRLDESTDSLLARFRRVEIDLHGGPTTLGVAPAAWLEMERAGDRVRFIDSNHSPAGSESDYHARCPSGAITVRPMTLREIFIALARATRAEAKGAAA
ncbi:MAG TPA: ABC transporter ATP-binding protein [Opitutus sp.]|nr:ABC transporter ATP-binding protein [Opitutus sp.]